MAEAASFVFGFVGPGGGGCFQLDFSELSKLLDTPRHFFILRLLFFISAHDRFTHIYSRTHTRTYTHKYTYHPRQALVFHVATRKEKERGKVS